MGNEKSQPSGLSIDETAIEVTDSWSLHGATYAIGNTPKISVFISTCFGSSDVTHLEKFTRNVMIYRHPSLLKYVASWKKGNKFHLATEQVQPLAQVLPSQTSLQICVGLQNILKALVFLHEFGCASHNNVCQAAVYVTQGGSWKLGGLEYLCRFSEMSSSYLEETRAQRYDPAISPNEADQFPQPLSALDVYAFGVLAQEVLANKNTDDVPGMADFLDTCKNQLQSSCEARPSLSSLLTHHFFSHEFLAIHNFLVELAIKKESEKQDFFRGLTLKLSTFPEETVASQLGSLLLSRMVLLDSTAQAFLLPQVFIPRKDGSFEESLFSENTFKIHIVPRLLPLFCVRDVQIRLILLLHFHAYCSLISQVHLQTRILPELLVGIKDTNDTLVCSTLKALAELVPILGGAVVIGGKRAKLFADGRPKVVKIASKPVNQKKPWKEETTLFTGMEASGEMMLSERPSPDGGEYIPTQASIEEDETWPDWDYKGGTAANEIKTDNLKKTEKVVSTSVTEHLQTTIEDLEFKVKPSQPDEFEDIFRDMEPIISKPNIIHVQEKTTTDKFALSSEVCEGADGWDEDFYDWNDIDEEMAVKDSVAKKS